MDNGSVITAIYAVSHVRSRLSAIITEDVSGNVCTGEVRIPRRITLAVLQAAVNRMAYYREATTDLVLLMQPFLLCPEMSAEERGMLHDGSVDYMTDFIASRTSVGTNDDPAQDRIARIRNAVRPKSRSGCLGTAVTSCSTSTSPPRQ